MGYDSVSCYIFGLPPTFLARNSSNPWHFLSDGCLFCILLDSQMAGLKANLSCQLDYI